MLGHVAVPPEGGPIDRDWGAHEPGLQTFARLPALYAIRHAARRVWISPILHIDDAWEVVFSQTRAPSPPRQPFFLHLPAGAGC